MGIDLTSRVSHGLWYNIVMDLVITAEYNETTVGFLMALAGDVASCGTRSSNYFLSLWRMETLNLGFSQSFRDSLAEIKDRRNANVFIREAFRRKGVEVIVKSVNAGTLDLCFDDPSRSYGDSFVEWYAKSVTTPELKTRVWGLNWLRKEAANPNVDFKSDAIALACEVAPRAFLKNPALPFLILEDAVLYEKLTKVATRVIDEQESKWLRFELPKLKLSTRFEVLNG